MRLIGAASVAFITTVFAVCGLTDADSPQSNTTVERVSNVRVGDGKTIFRFDTFGDEQLWTNVLRMQEPISTLAPVDALGVGLKVDLDALPADLIAGLRANTVDLTKPETTIQLLK